MVRVAKTTGNNKKLCALFDYILKSVFVSPKSFCLIVLFTDIYGYTIKLNCKARHFYNAYREISKCMEDKQSAAILWQADKVSFKCTDTIKYTYLHVIFDFIHCNKRCAGYMAKQQTNLVDSLQPLKDPVKRLYR